MAALCVQITHSKRVPHIKSVPSAKMSNRRETCVSKEDTFRLEPEETKSNVSAFVRGLNTCPILEGTKVKEKVDGTDLNAEEEGKKDDPPFPWLSKINDLCRSAVGSKNIKTLENLLTVYLQKVTSSVNDCYQKPIRATKLKACMNRHFVYFYFLYQDIKESVDNSLYLQKMTELMAMYLDLEIASSRRRKETTKKVVSRMASALNFYLDRSEDHILDALMRAKCIKIAEREVCCPILEKILTSFQKRQMQDTLYVRYLLVFKLWKKIVSDAVMRKKINTLAIDKLQAPANFADRYKRFNNVLPRVPNNKNITTFYMQAKLDVTKACQNFMKISKDPTLPVMADKPLFFEGRSQSMFSGKGNAFDGGVSRNLMNEIWSSYNEENTSSKKSSTNKKKGKKISAEKITKTEGKKEKSDSISESESTTDTAPPTPMDAAVPTWEAAVADVQTDVVMINAGQPPPPGTEPPGCIRIVPTALLLSPTPRVPMPPVPPLVPLTAVKQQVDEEATQPAESLFGASAVFVEQPETVAEPETVEKMSVKPAPAALAPKSEVIAPERAPDFVPPAPAEAERVAAPRVSIKVERDVDVMPHAETAKAPAAEYDRLAHKTDVPAMSEHFPEASAVDFDQTFEECEIQLGDQDLPYIEEEVVEPCNPVGFSEGDANYLPTEIGLLCDAGASGKDESNLVQGNLVAASQACKAPPKAGNGLWPSDGNVVSSAKVSSKHASPSRKHATKDASSTKVHREEVQRAIQPSKVAAKLPKDVQIVPLQIKSERTDSPGFDEALPTKADLVLATKPERVHSSKSNGLLSSKTDRVSSRADKVHSSKSGRLHSPKGDKIPTLSAEKPQMASESRTTSSKHDKTQSSEPAKVQPVRTDKMPILQPQQPSQPKAEKRHSSSSSSKSERSHHAHAVKIPSPKVEKPLTVRTDKTHSHSARVEKADALKGEMLPPSKTHSPRSEKSHSPRGEKSRSPRAERTNSPRIDGSQSPRADVTRSPRTETTSSPRAERTPSPRVETITSPRAEKSTSSRVEHSASPRSERIPSSRTESSTSHRQEASTSHRQEASTSHRPEKAQSPRAEKTPSLRHDLILSPKSERIRSPRSEKMPSPRSEAFVSPYTVCSSPQLNTFAAPMPVAALLPFVPPPPSFAPPTFVAPPPPPEPSHPLSLPCLAEPMFTVDTIQPAMQDHSMPSGPTLGSSSDHYALQQNFLSMESLMQTGDGGFSGSDDFPSEHFLYGLDENPFSGYADDFFLNISDFNHTCMFDPSLLEQRTSSEDDNNYQSFPVNPMAMGNPREVCNDLASRTPPDPFSLDSKWQYENATTIPSSMPLMAGDDLTSYTQYEAPASNYPNSYSATEYHNPGGMPNLPEKCADANTSFQSDSNLCSTSISETCDKNSLGQSYSQSKTPVNNGDTAFLAKEKRTMLRKLPESSGDQFPKPHLNPPARTDGFNPALSGDDKSAALKIAGPGLRTRSRLLQENSALLNCTVQLSSLQEDQRALGMSKATAARGGLRKDRRTSAAEKKAPRLTLSGSTSSPVGIKYKCDAFFGDPEKAKMDQGDTNQTDCDFTSEKEMGIDGSRNKRILNPSVSKAASPTLDASMIGASRKRRKLS